MKFGNRQDSFARGPSFAPAGLLSVLLVLICGLVPAQPPDLEELTRTASALLAEGDLEGALKRFRRALELRPDDPALEFNVGLALFRMGRFDECLAPLERARLHRPSAQQALFLQGSVHFHRGNFAEAAPLLDGARDHPELGEQALYMLVEVYRHTGAVGSAQEAFLDLQRLFPGSAFYHKLMGAAFDAEGMHAEAVGEFRRALRKDPAMPDVAFAVGFLYFKQREFEQASEWLRKELALQPCHAKATFYLAEISAIAGAVPEAEQRYRRAIACDSGEARGYSGLGRLLVRQGRYEDALGPLQQAVTLDPRIADAHYSLGQALLRLGRRDDAEAAFERVEAIHAARHSTAKRALGTSEQTP